MNYKNHTIIESYLGKFKTLKIIRNSNQEYFEIALKGATILNFNINHNNAMINIIDGFQTEEELENSSGARSWIMTPFSNRIRDGKYFFEGKEFIIKPIPPRTQVIHGFNSYYDYEVKFIKEIEDGIEIEFYSDLIRKNKFEGFPFDLDVIINFKWINSNFIITVKGINVGDTPAPFGTGWHPYFKTCDYGIEHLLMYIDAEHYIRTDSNLIPLEGSQAICTLDDRPDYKYDLLPYRTINKKIFDICYVNINKSEKYINNFIIDPHNKIKISVFQKGGLTLVFSGDTLKQRARKSIAIEPVQFMTNAFNRNEYSDRIKISPNNYSEFIFGFNYY